MQPNNAFKILAIKKMTPSIIMSKPINVIVMMATFWTKFVWDAMLKIAISVTRIKHVTNAFILIMKRIIHV
jgi:hypothetical protein